MGRYDDIINENQPPLFSHMRMKREDRAAQFAPFAAMVGHDRMIAEAMRYVGKRRELDDYEKEEINRALTELNLGAIGPLVSVTYFKPDERKEGGEYVTLHGEFKKIMLHEGVLVLKNGAEIKLDDIEKITPLTL